MKIAYECIPCLARQAVEIAEEITDDRKIQEQIISASIGELGKFCFNEMAPEIAHRMHSHAKRLTGIVDPYKALKADCNIRAMAIAQMLREENRIEGSEDPFDTACRVAIAGNIIDFSVGLALEAGDILQSVEDSLVKPIYGVGSKALKEAIMSAQNILYLADNSGEIVFDRFLIEQMPLEKVTLAVKGGPIVNDATREDAVSTGLADLVKVIDNGHDAQGTILTACSEAFLEAFDQADLIISKGQANFETLNEVEGKRIFFLMRAKCQSVAKAIGCERMAFVLTDALPTQCG